MPRNVPYKDSGSTPTCDDHLDAEQNAEWCPYCALAELLKFCDVRSGNETEYERAVTHARAVMNPKRRRRR